MGRTQSKGQTGGRPWASPVTIRSADGTVRVEPALTYRQRRNLAKTGNRESRRPIKPEIRKQVYERDGYRCVYCHTETGPFHLDHVRPYSKGGWDHLSNLVTACGPCNMAKGNRWNGDDRSTR